MTLRENSLVRARLQIGRSAYCVVLGRVAHSPDSRPRGQGERGDEGIQGVRTAAEPPFQGVSLGALRRGPLGRAILAVGLLSLLASYVIPFALTLRMPANEKQAPLPLLQAPAFRFPTIDPAKATPTPAGAREAAPGTTPAPSSSAPAPTRVAPSAAPQAAVPVVKSTYTLVPPPKPSTAAEDDRFANAPVVDTSVGSAPPTMAVPPPPAPAKPVVEEPAPAAAPVEHVEQTTAVDPNAAAAAAAIAALQAAIDAANAAAAGTGSTGGTTTGGDTGTGAGTGTAGGEEDTGGDETITPGETGGGDAIVASSAPSIASTAQTAIAPTAAAPVYEAAPVYVPPAPAPVVVDGELTGIEVTSIDSTQDVEVAPAELDLPAITTETLTDAGGPAASEGSSDGTVAATPPASSAAGGSASPTADDPATGSTGAAATETSTPDSTLLPPWDPAADPGSSRAPPALTAAELDPVVAAATAEWIAARPDADFAGLTVSIDDLAGMQLGYTVGTSVTIDIDAGGWGWDVSSDGAEARMSLHAVVLHELGHVLGLEHEDDGVMQPSLHPGETRTLVVAGASTGSPSTGASEASGAAQTILELIGATLAQYVTGAISGDHEFTASDDVNIGGVLTILAPTLNFQGIVVSGTSLSPIFSGTVAVASASATLNVLSGTTTFTGSVTNLVGSYTLAAQAGDRGLLHLAAQNLQIAMSGFAAVAAAAVVLESQKSGLTTEVRVGASAATATLGAAADPRVQISGASLAVLARKADAAAAPTFALIASGNAALIAATGITLTGANWRVAYNDLGDLSAAPVTVETGAGGVAVGFAANVRSVSGTGTVTVSTSGGHGLLRSHRREWSAHRAGE